MTVRSHSALPLALLFGIGVALVVLTHVPKHMARLSTPRARSQAAASPWSTSIGNGARVPTLSAMTHGDGRRTHRAAGIGPQRANVIWKTSVGGAVATQPILAMDKASFYVATLAGELLKLNLDGAIQWRKSLGGRAYGAPAITSTGSVVVGSDDHALFAYSPEGALLFRLKLDDEVDVPLLARADESVVVAAGNQILSVSARGNVLFRFETKKKIYTAPAEGTGGQLYFGAQDHHAYALSARGDLLWRVDLGADVDGSPAVADDESVVFGTDKGELIRVAPTGSIVSRTQLGGFVRGGVALSRSGDALVGTYGPQPGLARVHADGRLAGVFSVPGTGAKEFGVHGGALEDDTGAIFFGAQDNRLYALEPDGKQRFTLETSGDIDAPVTLLPGGRLLVASEDGNVYCVGN